MREGRDSEFMRKCESNTAYHCHYIAEVVAFEDKNIVNSYLNSVSADYREEKERKQ